MARYRNVNGERIAFTAEEEKIKDAEEKAWTDGKSDRDLAELRTQRNILLAETDYMALSDVTMSDEMKNYRQSLRDITKTYKSLNDDGFAFPTKPS